MDCVSSNARLRKLIPIQLGSGLTRSLEASILWFLRIDLLALPAGPVAEGRFAIWSRAKMAIMMLMRGLELIISSSPAIGWMFFF